MTLTVGAIQAFAGFPLVIDATLAPNEMAVVHDGKRTVFRLDLEEETATPVRMESIDPGGCAPPVIVGTPSSRWLANGEADPHGDRYACERAALALGDLTDDELANAVFLHGDNRPTVADMLSGKAMAPGVYLTAAKDRIRWLSRQLVQADARNAALLKAVEWARDEFADKEHVATVRNEKGLARYYGDCKAKLTAAVAGEET